MTPEEACRKLAEAAAYHARMRAKEVMNAHNAEIAILPWWSNKEFGLKIAEQFYWYEFQNWGIRPFTMWSLEGKTIPIKTPFGIQFRVAKDVGKPGRINKRDPETGRILPGNVGVRWRHPGLKPKNFIEYGMEVAHTALYDEILRELYNDTLAKKIKSKLTAGFLSGVLEERAKAEGYDD